MRVLVLGAGGLLGSNVVTEAADRSEFVAGAYHSTPPPFDVPLDQLDIRDRATFCDLLDRHGPDVIVNCAAMTDVDGCEDNPEMAREVNGRAPGQLAEICHNREIAFVHVSTDYVFDGTGDTLYDESSTTGPIQVYGKSKLHGEHAVQDAHDGALLPRLSFVWGLHRGANELTGFPAWLRGRLLDAEQTPLFTDQHVTPTRAGAAAATMFDLVESGQEGLFHVASRSCVTPYAFGTAFCDRLDADAALVEEGQQADIDRPASRPTYTCLDVSKVETVLDRPQPTLEADLDRVEPLL